MAAAKPYRLAVRNPSSMYPMFAIVEYASIRLMFVCEIAIKLPSTIESTQRMISIPCQSTWAPCSAPESMRSVIANAAIFGAVPIRSVTAVGAPS